MKPQHHTPADEMDEFLPLFLHSLLEMAFNAHPTLSVALPFQLMIVSDCQAPLNAWVSSKKKIWELEL